MKKEELRKLYSTVYSIEYLLNVDIGIITKDVLKDGVYTEKLDNGYTVRIDQNSILFIDPDGEYSIQINTRNALSIIKIFGEEELKTLTICFEYLAKNLEPVDMASSVSADLASNRIKDIIRYLY
jgi:hypothetical protein|nr:MAG TPA: hypothetical protein [Caudoviricetes sp.]